tara:strand:+ start:151 stop:495 length:345 start_codon:yes stop_codon:yes gene_type:complete
MENITMYLKYGSRLVYLLSGFTDIYTMNNNPFHSKPITEGRIRWGINQTKSMTQASKLVGCSYTTFKKYAKLYGLWSPNQEGKGIPKRKTIKIKSDIDFDLDKWNKSLKDSNLI